MLTSREYARLRLRMVDEQLVRRGINDRRVLDTMRNMPRHHFVPEEFKDSAYADRPLPIGEGQTISQPYIVAFMSERLRLKPEHTVLEVGTGSGYPDRHFVPSRKLCVQRGAIHTPGESCWRAPGSARL